MSRRVGFIGVILTFLVTSAIAQNTFPASGNVGIGTTSPVRGLDIAGGAGNWWGSGGLRITGENPGIEVTDNTASQRWLIANGVNWGYDGYWGLAYDATHNRHNIVVTPSGAVGIGTTSPAAKLDVGDLTGLGTLETVLARLGEGNTNGDGTYLGVRSWCTQAGPCNTTYPNLLSFSIEHHFYGQTNSSINFFRGGDATGGFITFATNVNNERLRIDSGGNIGIGTTSPSAKLEVSGSLKLASGSGGSITFQDGTVQSTAYTGVVCGGDYAESVDVTGDRAKYEPGDVLVIDPDHLGKFLKSAEPYSTSVFGVFSTKPGTVGRRQTTPQSPDEVPMAMVGIVPTKVSAENGPIKPGDLLVSSSTPGYAMKGLDRNKMLGAVIGKAMGHLDAGVGVIEVGVTLQ